MYVTIAKKLTPDSRLLRFTCGSTQESDHIPARFAKDHFHKPVVWNCTSVLIREKSRSSVMFAIVVSRIQQQLGITSAYTQEKNHSDVLIVDVVRPSLTNQRLRHITEFTQGRNLSNVLTVWEDSPSLEIRTNMLDASTTKVRKTRVLVNLIQICVLWQKRINN